MKNFADENKLILLGNGICDPFMGDLNTYRNCRNEICNAIDALILENTFSSITVKLTVKENIPEIAKLEKICFSTPWSEASLLEALDNGTTLFTAFYNKTIAGYMGISCILDEGYITNIAVFPNFRKKGIATAMLKNCINLAKEKKLAFISLEVRESNKKAIGLYEKLGFKTVGVRKNFYTNPCENAKIMTKRFDENENS